jgi:hypothetical protein
MIISSNYPTVFAKRLARKVGLYDVKSNLEYRLTISDYEEDELDQHKTLAEFQQMAISSKFEDCLIAFHGQKINKKQSDALQIIHKSTVPWLLGHVAGQLTEKINSSNDKDFVDACESLVEILLKEQNGTGGNGISKTGARKLLIKLKS